MVKFKVTQAIVNRGGKRYIAKDWIVEVAQEDVKSFEGFKKAEVKNVTPKVIKDEDKK